MKTEARIQTQARAKRNTFFRRAHGDSPFKLLLIHAALIVAVIISIYPLLRVVAVSLRPGDRLLTTDLSLVPAGATWESYRQVLFESDFLVWLWNSLLVSAATVVVGLFLAATAAYAISRWRFPGRRPALLFLLTTQMIPAGMMLLPIYVMVVRLGLFNSYIGIIIAYAITAVPFSIWLLRGYYDTIPVELEEAAKIDGASDIAAFYRIILPLSTPALAIAGLFNFTTAWNEYLVARVMLQRPELFTWPLGLQRMQGQFQTQWGMFSAASVLIAIPVMALFLYSSRWLISGMTLGGVKE